jgi:TrmH family RNA methyltransferase
MRSIAITSRQHPLCKLVRALSKARERRERGLFVAPGTNAVDAALRAGWPIEHLIVDARAAKDHGSIEAWEQRAHAAGAALTLADTEILAYLSDVPSAPEVLAIARATAVDDSQPPGAGLTLVLDSVGDPGNVGTLIRSADAAGADAVVTSANSADAFGLKAIRASAGSVFHLPPRSWADRSPARLAARFVANQVPIVIAAAHGGQDCAEFRWPARCALVLGHETRGIASPWATAAAAAVTIDMHGRAESLNVASAGAVLLFAWREAQKAL